MSTKKGPALELPYIVEDLRTLAIPIDEPVLDPANARTGHDIDRIAQSLAIYRQRVPIVVNVNQNNKVEKGNGTLLAARKLGWTHIAAIRVKDDPMTAAGFGIADNRVGDLSTWDLETLRTLLDSMDDEVFTGFIPEEIDELMKSLEQEHGVGKTSPEEFNEYDEELETEYCCPKCGYEWSGKPS